MGCSRRTQPAAMATSAAAMDAVKHAMAPQHTSGQVKRSWAHTLPLLLLLLLVATSRAASAAVPVPRTFGNGVIAYVRNSTFSPLLVLEHNLSSDAVYGVMTHYWSTGEQVNWDTVVDYWVDGEEAPSVSLMEDMACGQGFPKAAHGTYNGHGGHWDGSRDDGNGTFAAGEKMGKAGEVGGYYHYHKILFQKSIKVTARSLGSGNQVVYMVVRGHEVARTDAAASGLRLPSGFTVPPNAKLQLQRIDNQTFQPLEFVPLVTLPPGQAGLLYLTTFATQTIPAGNNYIEGCWHLFTKHNAAWPGIVMGTGVEDYFVRLPNANAAAAHAAARHAFATCKGGQAATAHLLREAESTYVLLVPPRRVHRNRTRRTGFARWAAWARACSRTPPQACSTSRAPLSTARTSSMAVRKNAPLVSHYDIKTIILPRKARDKHRESGEKEAFFAGRPTATTPKNDSIWSTVEKLSAYRFFDQEVVGFADGGALHWRNGDVGGKCGGCPPGACGAATSY
jgi:hypothetical protein